MLKSGSTAALIGESGAGKSSLVNALVGGEILETGVATWVWAIIGGVAIIILLAVGAFFFLEFEEFEDEDYKS